MIVSNDIKERSVVLKPMANSIEIFVLCLIAFLALMITNVARSETFSFEPPGQLVEVNGRHMHITCIGNKSPSIILDSGAGGFSMEWKNIQDSLSQYARVCAYDRAGYGWSDMGPLPRSTKNIAH